MGFVITFYHTERKEMLGLIGKVKCFSLWSGQEVLWENNLNKTTSNEEDLKIMGFLQLIDCFNSVLE